jgi:hypothetical protein
VIKDRQETAVPRSARRCVSERDKKREAVLDRFSFLKASSKLDYFFFLAAFFAFLAAFFAGFFAIAFNV